MTRNQPGQKLVAHAFDANGPRPGDAANITCRRRVDGGPPVQLEDVNPVELDAAAEPGWYQFDLTAAETNGSTIVFVPRSTTPGVQVLAVPSVVDPSPLAATVAHTNPVDVDGGRLTVVAGDDYASGAGRVPAWTVTGYDGPALAAAGVLRLARVGAYTHGPTAAADLEAVATIAAAGSTLTVTAPLTAAETGSLTAQTDRAGFDTHRYQLVGFAAAGGAPVTLKLGPSTVLRRVEPRA